MPAVTMRELLEAGVHFGHQTRRWNPKMRRFIFTERSGIYIIDLQKTIKLVEEAHDFARRIGARGGSVLFVGTKKQAREAVQEYASTASQPYVNHRWLGGLLTNFRTISERIAYLHELRRLKAEGQLDLLPAKERMRKLGELEKLEINLGGVADMRRLPDAVFVIDLKAEMLAVREARRLNIPLIGLVDTNCDPDEVDLVIPGNDDAIRSCSLIARVISQGVAEGRATIPSAAVATTAPAAEAAEGAEGAAAPAEGEAPPAAAEAAAAPVEAAVAPAEAPAAPAEPTPAPEPAVAPEPAAPAAEEPAAEAPAPPAEPAAEAAAEPAAEPAAPAEPEAATAAEPQSEPEPEPEPQSVPADAAATTNDS
jgi:small subunit ribosomal protein S2